MEVFVARKPIFDASKVVYGYELQFKSDFDTYYDTLCENNKKDKTNVDFMAFVNYGELTNHKPGFVNFSESLLLKDFPRLLPRERLAVGLPTLTGQASQELLETCQGLKNDGYDMFINIDSVESIDNPLIGFVKFAKVDFSKVPEDQRLPILEKLKYKLISGIAYNVEAISESENALKWGYPFFHGEFSSKPVVDTDNAIKNSKLAYFRILQEVNRPELSYDQIARIIKHDVALTYKLLRFINSSWFGLKYEIHSIKHALVLLGPKEIKKWAALVAMSNTGEDKPKELLQRALSRARAAELIAQKIDMTKQAPELFLMGMFSLIDALTDTPMSTALESIPLNDRIRTTLLGDGDRMYAEIFQALLAYEDGDWSTLSRLATELNIDEFLFPKYFREAWTWATNALEAL